MSEQPFSISTVNLASLRQRRCGSVLDVGFGSWQKPAANRRKERRWREMGKDGRTDGPREGGKERTVLGWVGLGWLGRMGVGDSFVMVAVPSFLLPFVRSFLLSFLHFVVSLLSFSAFPSSFGSAVALGRPLVFACFSDVRALSPLSPLFSARNVPISSVLSPPRSL